MTTKKRNPEDIPDENLHFVIAADDLEQGDRVITELQGKEIAVFNVDGEYHAIANYCTHQGGPVCEGPLHGTIGVDEDWDMVFDREDELIVCPWHGWSFEIESGHHIAKSKYTLPTYDVIVKQDSVYVVI